MCIKHHDQYQYHTLCNIYVYNIHLILSYTTLLCITLYRYHSQYQYHTLYSSILLYITLYGILSYDESLASPRSWNVSLAPCGSWRCPRPWSTRNARHHKGRNGRRWVCMCIHMYIHNMDMFMYMYIYIYIYDFM